MTHLKIENAPRLKVKRLERIYSGQVTAEGELTSRGYLVALLQLV